MGFTSLMYRDATSCSSVEHILHDTRAWVTQAGLQYAIGTSGLRCCITAAEPGMVSPCRCSTTRRV